jgi:hypothetical protein
MLCRSHYLSNPSEASSGWTGEPTALPPTRLAASMPAILFPVCQIAGTVAGRFHRVATPAIFPQATSWVQVVADVIGLFLAGVSPAGLCGAIFAARAGTEFPAVMDFWPPRPVAASGASSGASTGASSEVRAAIVTGGNGYDTDSDGAGILSRLSRTGQGMTGNGISARAFLAEH